MTPTHKLVPVEATADEIEAAHRAMYSEPYTGETAVALGAGIDAARAAAPNQGRVCREQLQSLAALIAEAQIENTPPIEVVEAFIATIGLEIEGE